MTAPSPRRGSSVPDAEQSILSTAAHETAGTTASPAAAGASSPTTADTPSPSASGAPSPTAAETPSPTAEGPSSPQTAGTLSSRAGGTSPAAAGTWSRTADGTPSATAGATSPTSAYAGAAAQAAPHGPQTGPGGTARPSGDTTTATDVLDPEDDVDDELEKTREESRALAVARVAGGPAPAAESAVPPLIPDAILPPGVTPAEPEEPDAEPAMDATRPTPTIGPGGPGGPFPDGSGTSAYGSSPGTGRRALLIGGGALAALLLGGGTVVAYTTASGNAADRHPVVRHTPAAPPPMAARPSPSKTVGRHRPKAKLVRVDIRDEKKDPVPLGLDEVFPGTSMKVAGHTFVIAKTVLNNHCDLTANGAFAAALAQQHCRTVVRATLVSDDKKIAVTAGVAAMPTDAAAIAALKAQDPAHYTWFRGLKANGAPDIDGPGGVAASVRLGRYICYTYVMYADGHKPGKGDKTLQQVAAGFRTALAKPIDQRARSKVPQP